MSNESYQLLSAGIESTYKEYHTYDYLFKQKIVGDVIHNVKNNMSKYFISQTMAHFYIKNILSEEPIFNDKNKLIYDKATLIVDYYTRCLQVWGTPLIIRGRDIYIYNGIYYEPYLSPDSFANILLDGIGNQTSTRTTKEIKEVDERLKKMVIKEYVKHNRNIIPFKNCVIEIKQNGKIEIIKHSHELMNFYCLNYNYNSKMGCQEFKTFLDSSLPDHDLQSVLQEFIGWCLLYNNTKETKFEKALFLLGKGANGKSVIYEIVKAMLGDNNVSSYQLGELTTNANARAGAKNCLVNFCSDIERNGKIDHGTLKAMISGESVQYKRMREDVTTSDWNVKLIFNANLMPNHAEFTDAFFRRLIVIPFDKQFMGSAVDTGIADRVINKELGGVINWAIDGLIRLLANKGFTYSAKSNKSIIQYQDDVDVVKMWIRENELNGGDFSDTQIEGQLLYDKFRNFCMASGIDKFILTKQTFFKRLEDKIFISRVVRGKRYFYIKTENVGYLSRYDNGLSVST